MGANYHTRHVLNVSCLRLGRYKILFELRFLIWLGPDPGYGRASHGPAVHHHGVHDDDIIFNETTSCDEKGLLSLFYATLNALRETITVHPLHLRGVVHVQLLVHYVTVAHVQIQVQRRHFNNGRNKYIILVIAVITHYC